MLGWFMIIAPPAAENLFILRARFWLRMLAYRCCCETGSPGSTDYEEDCGSPPEGD